jgi:predicted amidohydrolase
VGFYLGYAELDRPSGVLRRFNTSILVSPDGSIVGRYRKIHLPGHVNRIVDAPFQHLEKRYFEVGNLGFPVWEAFGGQVGMCICNDRRWPETFRVMALQNAEIVALGFNTPTKNIYHDEPAHLRMLHHNLSLQAAAYQNGIWVAASAKCGSEDGHALHGGTCIVSPRGEIVSQAATEEDEVIAFNCDLDLGSYIRRTVFDFARHRRIEHYGLICSTAGVIEKPAQNLQAKAQKQGETV